MGAFGPHSRVFRFNEMPLHHMPNGNESHIPGHGVLQTGEAVSIHESVSPPDGEPAREHPIHHTEIICVRAGTVEFVHDGGSERAEAGDIVFVANGTVHAVRNVGSVPAIYTVVAIGGDVRPKPAATTS